jgi:hypothetical protein
MGELQKRNTDDIGEKGEGEKNRAKMNEFFFSLSFFRDPTLAFPLHSCFLFLVASLHLARAHPACEAVQHSGLHSRRKAPILHQIPLPRPKVERRRKKKEGKE